MDLNDIAIFERIVREGSFSAAAKSLGTAKSTLSTRIKRLEKRLGATLMARTTRRFTLTDAGAAYYEHCRQIVADAREAERAVQTLEAEPAGRLRISAPPVLAQRVLAPLIVELLDRHFGLRMELVVTDREVEPDREGFDVSLLFDPKDQPTLRSRDLGTFFLYPVASLRFITRYGRPSDASDLTRFRCVGERSGEQWHFESEPSVEIQPVLTVKHWEVARTAATGGIGIARLPVFMWRDDYASSRLIPILGKSPAGSSRLFARYRAGRYARPAVRAFLEALSPCMQSLEVWPRGA